MSIIRLIHIKIDPSETKTAERIWKTECATLMISQKGCISEKLLRARERGEFISYSEWETEADIERYTNSAAHKQIVNHTRSVKGASAMVKLHEKARIGRDLFRSEDDPPAANQQHHCSVCAGLCAQSERVW